MKSNGDRAGELSLKAELVDEQTIRVTVADNGEGIPPENLTRIFVHGFTTHANGHGFGLHSAALAAKEMGGGLSVHSDGRGAGATFTLDVPLERESVVV
jgi:signal transduction histidine kinase